MLTHTQFLSLSLSVSLSLSLSLSLTLSIYLSLSLSLPHSVVISFLCIEIIYDNLREHVNTFKYLDSCVILRSFHVFILLNIQD